MRQVTIGGYGARGHLESRYGRGRRGNAQSSYINETSLEYEYEEVLVGRDFDSRDVALGLGCVSVRAGGVKARRPRLLGSGEKWLTRLGIK